MDTEKKVSDFMQAFLDTPEPKIDEEYYKLEEDYKKIFNHIVPTEMLPDSISSDDIKDAMKKCIDSKHDNLMEILRVEINDKYLY